MMCAELALLLPVLGAALGLALAGVVALIVVVFMYWKKGV